MENFREFRHHLINDLNVNRDFYDSNPSRLCEEFFWSKIANLKTIHKQPIINEVDPRQFVLNIYRDNSINDLIFIKGAICRDRQRGAFQK